MGLRPTIRQRVLADHHVEATAFLREIVAVADGLKEARAFDGSEPLRFDARWRLLHAIERTSCCPSFSDLARSLRVSCQAARELVSAAEKTGSVRSFGLEPAAMRSTAHVLRVIRRRLQRYAQEMARARA